MLVAHGSVERQPIELVVVRGLTDLGHHDLDLVRLLRLGEDRAERLGVGVGQASSRDIAAVVGVAAKIGKTYAGNAQILELVVLAHRRERDPVVDLADLVQRTRSVLCHEQQAAGVLQHDHGTAPRDSFAGVVGLVLDDLLGRYVERHAHDDAPRSSMGTTGPSGRA